MFLHLFLIGTLQVLTLFGQYQAGDICAESETGKIYVTHENVNEVKCCEEKQCPAGFEDVFCSIDQTASECRRCKAGYFKADVSKTSSGTKCMLWKECSSSSKFTVKTEGTEVQDRTCKCDVTLGAYNKDTPVNPDYCQLKNCEAGTELTETGDCVPCQSGYYKPHKRQHSCIRKTECREHGLETDKDKTDPYSAVEDVYCKNVTELHTPTVELSETSVIPIHMTTTTTIIPVVAHVQQTNVKYWYLLGIGFAIVLLCLVGIVIFCCIKKRGNKHHQDPVLDVEMNKSPPVCKLEKEVPRLDKQGIEHDETSPLNSAPIEKGAVSSSRISRQPTECDEHYTSQGAYSAQNSEHKKYTRQHTVDSGYDGNCSSETESFHMSDSLEAVEEDVGATPSSTENHSLPTVAFKCDKCGKLEKNAVQNVVVINGPHSHIQMGNQTQMVCNESAAGPCSLCAHNSFERDESELNEQVEIERTGSDRDLEDIEEGAGVHTKLLKTYLPKTNGAENSLQEDEGIESFYRKTPVCNSIA